MTADPPAAARAGGMATDGFAAFYDRTSRAAFGLALRVTGDAEQAQTACAAAYAAAGWRLAGEVDRAKASQELLALVRQQALRLRPAASDATVAGPPPYARGEAVRAGLEQLDPLARRSIELAYFGGLGADEIAALLKEPPAEVRKALRGGLLRLGTLMKDEKGAR